MEYFVIEIEGNQFKQSYLIYVIEVQSKSHGDFYYVGQTGDRNHTIARPAFRRLGGHLSDQGQSTENQVYRQIAVHVLGLDVPKKQAFSLEIKRMVSKFLGDSKIKMHVFPIRPFDNEITKDEHKINREYVESIERSLIDKITVEYSPDKVLNRRVLPKLLIRNDEIDDWVLQIFEKICPTL